MAADSRGASWESIDDTLEGVLSAYPNPIDALARGELAAIVVRRAYPASHCVSLVKQFYELGLLYDPKVCNESPRRQNIGTVFGWSKGEPEAYFAASAAATILFSELFAGAPDPVQRIYDVLSALSLATDVVTAREDDGRVYMPAVVRAYPEGVGHEPHYDRACDPVRYNYAVTRVRQQLAVVLCLQNARDSVNDASQPIVYEATGTSEWCASLENGTFRERAAERSVRRVSIRLRPGDLYIFRSMNIHEVPAVRGDVPRIVLAAFCGVTESGEQILIWS